MAPDSFLASLGRVAPAPAPVSSVEDEWRARMLAALDQLTAAIADQPAPPVVHVPPADLSEIVTAVQGIKGPATADEIALALRDVLQPERAGESPAALSAVVEALQKLEFRMQGTQAYGGGSVTLSQAGRDQLAAAFAAALDSAGVLDVSDAANAARFGGGKTPVVATVTASGDTTIYTPAAGQAVRLFWVSAINDPDEASNPLIKILLGATELYRGYALAHWEVFEGAADEALVVNLSGAASVSVTAHIEEFTP